MNGTQSSCLKVHRPQPNILYCVLVIISCIQMWDITTVRGGEITLESKGEVCGFAYSACGVGDVNGDGYGDFAVGAPFLHNGLGEWIGRVFVYYGSATGLSPVAAWTGQVAALSSEFGATVAPAGDVNGDGFADLAVGAPEYSGRYTNQGMVAVYYGSMSGFASEPNWTAYGESEYAEFGKALASAGDVNGDHFSDLVVGAPFFRANGWSRGAAYVFMGGRSGLAQHADWRRSGTGTNGIFGWSVCGAGDVNADGNDDVIIGSPRLRAGQSGFLYLFQGADIGLSSNANADFAPIGYPTLGTMVARAGDVNGDGYSDILVNESGWSETYHQPDVVSIFKGSFQGLGTTAVNRLGWNIRGASRDKSIAGLGDVDGDGFDDIIVGYPFVGVTSASGGVMLYSGSSSGITHNALWSKAGDHMNALMGTLVGSAGDVNGDAQADVFIVSGEPSQSKITIITQLRSAMTLHDASLMRTTLMTRPSAEQIEADFRDESSPQYLSSNSVIRHERLLMLAPRVSWWAEDRWVTHRARWFEVDFGWQSMAAGRLDESMRHFVWAERLTRRQRQYQRPNLQWMIDFDTAGCIENQINLLLQQAQWALASRRLDDANAFIQRGLQGEVIGKKERHVYYEDLLLNIEVRSARMLNAQGKFKESTSMLIPLLERARTKRLRTQEGEILYVLACNAIDEGHMDVALQWCRERSAFKLPGNPVADYRAAILQDEVISLRDGGSLTLLEHVESLGRLVSAVENQKVSDEALLLKMSILGQLGRWEEAVTLAGEVGSRAHEQGFRITEAEALLRRAEGVLALGGDLYSAKTNCIESLRLYRAAGYKCREPYVYDICASVYDKMGEHDLAVRIWNYGIECSLTLGQSFDAIRLLCNLLESAARHGDVLATTGIWERLAEIVNQQSDLSELSLLDYHLAKLTYLRMTGQSEELEAARLVADSFVAGSALSAFQVDELKGSESKEWLAPSTKLVDKSAVFWSPLRMTTEVLPGEFARGRFQLWNPDENMVTGSVSLVEGHTIESISTTGFVYKLGLVSQGGGVSSCDVRVPPGSCATLYVETSPVLLENSTNVLIRWSDNPNVVATWTYDLSQIGYETAIVNASGDIENPFFHSVFYHEIYVRKSEGGEKPVNLKVTCSVPLRVELVDSLTDQLLSIDDNGDGDHHDSGDVIRQDSDGDGYPDLMIDTKTRAGAIELFLFPTGTLTPKGSIKIQVSVQQNGVWRLAAEDSLIVGGTPD